MSVPASGVYDLVLRHTVAPDYGDFSVFVAGKKAADVTGYAPAVGLREQPLGRKDLDTSVQLVFSVFGKQPPSTGFLVGLDRLELRPVAADSDRKAQPTASASQPAMASVAAPTERVRASLINFMALAQPTLEAYDDKRGFDTRGLRLDWRAPLLRPRFRWQPGDTGATTAVWEASTTPFPSNPGIRSQGHLASGRAALAAGQQSGQFEIDLKPYAPQSKRLRLPGKPFDPGVERPYVYVRLRALDAAGEFIGRPSEPITLFFGKPGKLKLPTKEANLPRVRLVSYRPPRPYTFDFQCRGRAIQDIYMMGQKVVAKGQKGDLCKSQSKDIFDHIEDAVGSVVDLVSSAVDWAATAYNDIKSTAMGAVVAGLKASGIGCGGECQFVMGAALDAGLAAVGMPPSLPEFDELVANLEQGGIDALAGTLAEAAASQGVPEIAAREAARRAAEELVAKAKQTVAGGGGGGKGIWKVDPAGLYSPAVIVIGATNLDAAQPSEAAYAKLDNVFSGHAGLFRFTGAKIPQLEPQRSLVLSFELEPLTWEAGWMDFLPKGKDCLNAGGVSSIFNCLLAKRAEAKAELARWTELYNGHEHRFRLSTEVDGDSHNVAELRCSGNAPQCAVRFAAPAWRGQRIDFCYRWGQACGQPAAVDFCKRMGYGGASQFERADDIGAAGPTRILGDGRTCSAPDCDGFASVTCHL